MIDWGAKVGVHVVSAYDFNATGTHSSGQVQSGRYRRGPEKVDCGAKGYKGRKGETTLVSYYITPSMTHLTDCTQEMVRRRRNGYSGRTDGE